MSHGQMNVSTHVYTRHARQARDAINQQSFPHRHPVFGDAMPQQRRSRRGNDTYV